MKIKHFRLQKKGLVRNLNLSDKGWNKYYKMKALVTKKNSSS